ncbi:MAG: fibronectin type III domain-containing protein, partial [Actinomycetes bacterium]
MTSVLCLVLSGIASLALIAQIGTGAARAAIRETADTTTELSAPVDLVGAAGNGQVTLNWQPPAEAAVVSGYLVEMKTFDHWWKVADVYGQTTSVVKGLTNAFGSYSFRVTAFNGDGPGVASAEVGPFTPVDPSWIPGAPSNVSAVVVGSDLRLRWQAPPPTAQQALTRIIGYAIEVQVGGIWASAVSNSWTSTSTEAVLPLPLRLEASMTANTMPSLTSQTVPAQVRVRAINAWTPTLPDGVGPPSQPCSFPLVGSSNLVTFPLVGSSDIVTTATSSVLVNGATIMSPRSFRAQNVVASPMAGVHLGARITWSAVDWGTSDQQKVVYKVEKSFYPSLPASWTLVSVVRDGLREASVGGLTQSLPWSFRVTPMYEANGGVVLAPPTLSNPVYPLPNPSLPSAPTRVSVGLVDKASAQVSWAPATPAGGTQLFGAVKGYIVEVQEEGSDDWRPATLVIPSGQTQARVDHLISGMTYRFRVRSLSVLSSFWQNPMPAIGEVSTPTPWITLGG